MRCAGAASKNGIRSKRLTPSATFLLDPAIDASNWRAEQALRPAVVTRKVCGGNRTACGAHTHEVLASVLRTIQQHKLDAGEVLSNLLRSPKPVTAFAPPPTGK